MSYLRGVFAEHNVAPAIWCSILISCLLALLVPTVVHAQSTPSAVIAIGDGPYALDVSADGQSAIVSLLFPAEDNDPNLFWVDLEGNAVVDSFRFGRRLFRIAAVDPALLKSGSGNGVPVVMVNGDVDKLTMAGVQVVQDLCLHSSTVIAHAVKVFSHGVEQRHCGVDLGCIAAEHEAKPRFLCRNLRA